MAAHALAAPPAMMEPLEFSDGDIAHVVLEYLRAKGCERAYAAFKE